ncbi:hypothetical protein BPIT_15340 [Candidatus Brocadia pituitae]|nr:hypothetical protein BPIT_15340 [Candidatus Brocadia pituitae]
MFEDHDKTSELYNLLSVITRYQILFDKKPHLIFSEVTSVTFNQVTTILRLAHIFFYDLYPTHTSNSVPIIHTFKGGTFREGGQIPGL